MSGQVEKFCLHSQSVKPEAEDSKQPRGSGEVGETGAGSKDVSGEEVKSKEKTADSSNRPQGTVGCNHGYMTYCISAIINF